MTTQLRGLLVTCILFAVYIATVSRSVGWEDSAFFQLAHGTLGVPHGPGFPLYVLAGRVWSLPFGMAVAWGGNLFSAAAMAAAGAVMCGLIGLLAGLAKGDFRSAWTTIVVLAVVLGWGTSEVIWQQAVRTEVYPLTLLLVLLTAYLSLTAWTTWEAERMTSRRTAMAALWVWGLGMAVHPLVFLVAGTPWLMPLLWKWRRSHWALMLGVCLAMAPLSLYLYPYLRGRLPGVWVWGSFDSIHNTLDYYLRRSAWAAVPDGQISYVENLRGWMFGLRHAWPVALWVPAAAAAFWLRRQWALWISLGGVAALVIWAAPFEPLNLDLWGYFLPFLAFAAVLVGVALVKAAGFLREQMTGVSSGSRQAIGFFAALVVLGWPAMSIVTRAEAPSPMAGAGGFVHALAASLPDSSTVLAAEDNVLGVLEYARRVERVRPDLNVIAPGALRYAFYRQQIDVAVPPELQEQWQSTRVWNEAEWNAAMKVWIPSLATRPGLFTQFDNLPGLPIERLVPAGFLYAIVDTVVAVPWSEAARFWQDSPQLYAHDLVAREIMSRWQFNFGALALARGDAAAGWEALVGAVGLAPENPEMYYRLGDALHRSGRAAEANSMFAAAFELAPYRAKYQKAVERRGQPLAAAR
jgi:hypothetical protein